MFLEMASLVAKRGTCSRAQVGCVLTNKFGHVLATGYNGVGRGLPHCNQDPCPGATVPIGQGTGTCEAIHAEQNALLQCKDVSEIDTVYVTMAPCLDCTKLFLNTGCKWIIYLEPHPKMMASIELWKKAKGIACFVSWDYLREIRETYTKPKLS
jgi:dCMP deaminase